jgi:ankyrin repeat protein
MKTSKIEILKAATKMTLVATLFIIAGCSNKPDSTDANATSTTVKPPQVDIHTAVVTGNMDALKQHIAAGSNINEKDPFGGSSPLISAAVFGKTEEARVLIDAGADLNFQNNDGSTALLSAAFFCRPEIVKMLLEKNADKTIKNKFGATAYESVAAPFNDVKPSYDMIGKLLEPMGLKLDYVYVEKTRPEIAAMLK